MGLLETAALSQAKYLASKPESERRELGQFFTGAPVAQYMSTMIEKVEATQVRILDGGSGAGILTMALAQRCLELGNRSVHAVLYEIDEEIIGQLKANLTSIARKFASERATFTFDIRNQDFILARPDKTLSSFHLASINPPYFKYNSKTSSYAGATSDLFKGNPNIYASFMAVVGASLTHDGQMTAIVPRSFTNGLYFKGFRHFLINRLSLEKIHIFRARDKVFKEQSVLQENVICSFIRRAQADDIAVITSTGYSDIADSTTCSHAADLLIDQSNDHAIIRIPESENDADILRTVERWPSSFSVNGYFISTGPVVEHRTREFICPAHHAQDSVPLLRMHNVKGYKTTWTGEHKKDVRFDLRNGHKKHTSSNIPYVILKRFSSKDEKRRLVAGVHDPGHISGELIALENHLNYIGLIEGQFDLAEAFGLAGLFNSTFMDKYFRCISGNTQVNATEIRLMKLPTRVTIRAIGELVMVCSNPDQAHIDVIVESILADI